MNVLKDSLRATANDFFISSDIIFNDTTTRYAKSFTTGIKGEYIHWELCVVCTIHKSAAIYLLLRSDMKIEAKCNFYVSFKPLRSISDMILNRTTDIYCLNKEVFLYQTEFLIHNISFNFNIRGTIIKIRDVIDYNFPSKIETIPLTVLKNLESFLMDQKFCDVTFQTSDTMLSAHKNILAAQSPVFKRMFSTDMKEVKPGIVIDMKNVEGVVLKEMFRFMYGGRVENIEKIADKLLILANKYEIEPLMSLCEKVLYDKLTVSNAISTIKIADIHNAKILRRLTEEFIIKNKKALLDTAEFKSLTSTNPQLVIDILKANLQ